VYDWQLINPVAGSWAYGIVSALGLKTDITFGFHGLVTGRSWQLKSPVQWASYFYEVNRQYDLCMPSNLYTIRILIYQKQKVSMPRPGIIRSVAAFVT